MRTAVGIFLGLLAAAAAVTAWRWSKAPRPPQRHQGIGPILVANGTAIELGHLAASDHGLDAAGLRDLLDVVPVAALRTLRASGNQLDAAAGTVLATHAKLAKLEVLLLDANVSFGSAGLRALVGAPWWATLEAFSVTTARISEGDAFSVVRGAPRLKDIGVGYNPVGDAVVPHLLACPALTAVDLRETRISGAGVRGVLGHPGIGLLLLEGTPLGPGALAASGEDGARAVREAHGARTLSLDLAKTGISAADVRWLLASGLPVTDLDVSHNNISDAGLDALAEAPGLDTFEALDAFDVGASEESRARLRARWGNRPGLTL